MTLTFNTGKKKKAETQTSPPGTASAAAMTPVDPFALATTQTQEAPAPAQVKVETTAAVSTTGQLQGSSVSVPLTEELAKLVTIFVRGRNEIDPFKPLIKDIEAAKETLAAFVGTHVPNDEPAMIRTSDGEEIGFGAAPDTRVVKDMDGLIAALRKVMPREDVLKLLYVKLPEVEKYLGQVEVEKYVEHSPGTRRVASYVCPSATGA